MTECKPSRDDGLPDHLARWLETVSKRLHAELAARGMRDFPGLRLAIVTHRGKHIIRCYETAAHSLTSRLCRIPGTPLTRLTLGAAPVADDLGHVALSDLARAVGDISADCRVIGGHMVTVLAARWRLGRELCRETGDVDLGIPPIVARDHHHVVGRLKDLDYTQVAGNRFARGLSDIPVTMTDKEDLPRPEAFIDVLVPAYTSRPRENVQVGEDLFTTEVPGLQLALARPPVTIELELRRLNGAILRCELPFPDEVSALVLKSLATTVRSKDTDISDIWRCLEIVFAAGVGPADFARGVRADSAEAIRSLLRSRRGAPMAALASEQRLSAEEPPTCMLCSVYLLADWLKRTIILLSFWLSRLIRHAPLTAALSSMPGRSIAGRRSQSREWSARQLRISPTVLAQMNRRELPLRVAMQALMSFSRCPDERLVFLAAWLDNEV
jgi:hypothetical protein